MNKAKTIGKTIENNEILTIKRQNPGIFRNSSMEFGTENYFEDLR